MSTKTRDFSVVICAYTEDRWDDLLSAVTSVRSQLLSPLEIIVVVDHNPVLLSRVRRELPRVIAVENTEPRGLSGARNSGIAAAHGEFVAFLDEDASAADDWLARLSDIYDDPKVMGAGGAVEPRWPGKRPRWFPKEFDWVVGCSYQGLPEAASPVRNLLGCNMSYRREVFENIGMFTNGIGRVGLLPVGCEETEFCIRAHQFWPDRTLIYEPRAVVHHRVHSNRVSWGYFRDRCYSEGRSKALVSRLVGTGQGLASERIHALRTLPLGVIRGFTDFLGGSDPMGVVRGGAIVTGLLCTAVGYLLGTVTRSPAHLRAEATSREALAL